MFITNIWDYAQMCEEPCLVKGNHKWTGIKYFAERTRSCLQLTMCNSSGLTNNINAYTPHM